jgi:5-methylcytosine-specific restriction endonuclease McrA
MAQRPSTTARGYGARWQAIRHVVFRIHGRVCHRCGGYADAVDHLTPKAAGGGDSLDNLRPICRRCNSAKAGAWVIANRGNPRVKQAAARRRSTTPQTPRAPTGVLAHVILGEVGVDSFGDVVSGLRSPTT